MAVPGIDLREIPSLPPENSGGNNSSNSRKGTPLQLSPVLGGDTISELRSPVPPKTTSIPGFGELNIETTKEESC